MILGATGPHTRPSGKRPYRPPQPTGAELGSHALDSQKPLRWWAGQSTQMSGGGNDPEPGFSTASLCLSVFLNEWRSFLVWSKLWLLITY